MAAVTRSNPRPSQLAMKSQSQESARCAWKETQEETREETQEETQERQRESQDLLGELEEIPNASFEEETQDDITTETKDTEISVCKKDVFEKNTARDDVLPNLDVFQNGFDEMTSISGSSFNAVNNENTILSMRSVPSSAIDNATAKTRGAFETSTAAAVKPKRKQKKTVDIDSDSDNERRKKKVKGASDRLSIADALVAVQKIKSKTALELARIGCHQRDQQHETERRQRDERYEIERQQHEERMMAMQLQLAAIQSGRFDYDWCWQLGSAPDFFSPLGLEWEDLDSE